MRPPSTQLSQTRVDETPNERQQVALDVVWRRVVLVAQGREDHAQTPVALEQMPGGAGLKIFFKSVQRAGSSAELLAAGRAAVDDYERLIEVHSGDRTTLEMMGSELSPIGRRERDEHHRKMLFLGASYVWGVQTRVIAGARQFVGTCGGLAWLAPFLGVDTLAVYEDDRYLTAHMYAARYAYRKNAAARFSTLNIAALRHMDAGLADVS